MIGAVNYNTYTGYLDISDSSRFIVSVPGLGVGSGGGGFNIGSLVGGISTGNGNSVVGSIVGGAVQAIPGVGQAVSAISNILGKIIPGGPIKDQLKRFIRSGFAFSCLGRQAFTDSDVVRLKNVLNDVATPIFQRGNIKEIENLMNDLIVAHWHYKEWKNKLRSKCSKNLANAYGDFLWDFVYNGVMKQFPDGSWTDEKGVYYTQKIYKGGDNWRDPFMTKRIDKIVINYSGNSGTLGAVPQWFQDKYSAEVRAYSLQSGVPYDQLMSMVWQQYIMNGGSATPPSTGGGPKTLPPIIGNPLPINPTPPVLQPTYPVAPSTGGGTKTGGSATSGTGGGTLPNDFNVGSPAYDDYVGPIGLVPDNGDNAGRNIVGEVRIGDDGKPIYDVRVSNKKNNNMLLILGALAGGFFLLNKK